MKKLNFFRRVLPFLALLVLSVASAWAASPLTLQNFSFNAAQDVTLTTGDANISLHALKGSSGTNPGNYNNGIRLYQASSTGGTGGYLVIAGAEGVTISSVAITTTSTYSTTFKYSTDGGSTLSNNVSIATSSTQTISNLSSNSVNIYNTGTGSKGRLEVAKLVITYSGGGSTPTGPTALSVPANLASSDVTTTGATLSWDAVANASSYTVKIGETEYTNVNTNSYSATGLTAGTEYTWTVKAVGDGTNYSTSDYAANANFTTEAESGDEPSGDGTEVTWTASEQGYANAQKVETAEVDANVSLAFGDGDNDGKFYTTGNGIRIYANGKMTVTAANSYTISQIVIGFSATGNTGTISASTGEYSLNSTTGTWTGSAKSIVFTNTAASGNARIQTVTVTYAADGNPEKTTPILSFANPTYNATMGEAFVAPTLTKSHEVTVSYTSSEIGVATVNSTTGAIELVAPGTTKITASFGGNDTYNAASASYQLVVAVAPLTTMDAIFTAATAAGSTATDCRVTFNNWVVSGVKNNNAYVTDNAGKGFIIYTSGHGFVAGDILSGTAACKVQLYNGSSELTALTSSTEGLTVTKGGVITPITTIALASLSGVNTGAVLSYENLEYNGTNFTDGATNLKPYNGLITLPDLISGKNYNVTGVYVQYNATKEIAPRTAEDFELIEVINYYTVTFAETLNGTITVKNGETVIKDGDEVAEGTTLTIECTPASGYKFRNWQYKAGEAAWASRTADFSYTMPSENVQFRANFDVIPTFTVAWSVNGTVVKSDELLEGAAVTALADPEDINGKVFTGWIETATVEGATPAYVTPATTASKTITYYAVFATRSGSGATSWTKVTDVNQVVAGTYALISYDEAYYLANAAATSNAPIVTAVTKTNDAIDVLDAMKWNLTIDANGKYIFESASNSGNYLWGANTNEGIRINTSSSKSGAFKTWVLYSTNDYGLVLKDAGTTGRYLSTYGTQDWRNYTSVSNTNRAANLYKLGGGYTYSDYTTIVAAPTPAGGTISFVATDGENYYATFSNDRVIKFDEAFINDDESCAAAIKAYAIAVVDGELYLTDQYTVNNDGSYTYIPKNTGILFKYTLVEGVADLNVPFEYADDVDGFLNEVEDNMLKPATGALTEGDGCLFYKLAYGDWTNRTGLGFYWGAEKGAAFEAKAGGAYLAVPESAGAPARFVFNSTNTATGVDTLENSEDAVKFMKDGQLFILRNGVLYNAIGQVVK